MAIWLTKQRATKGPVFGFVDKFEGLGIFFDTYKNSRPSVAFPYVMAMLGDGQTAYDQAHDGKANELAGCSVSCVFSFDTNSIHLNAPAKTKQLGSRTPRRIRSHKSPHNLFPGQIPLTRPTIQIRPFVDPLLHRGSIREPIHKHPHSRLPRYLR